MAKVIVDVVLKDGVNQDTFVSSFDDISDVELDNKLESIPTLVSLNVERSYLPTLESNPSVKSVSDPDALISAPVTYPSEPSNFTLTNKTIGWVPPNSSSDGKSNLSYLHYLNTDVIVRNGSPTTLGNNYNSYNNHYEDGDWIDQDNHTYYNKYNGKNVDIVIAELATTPDSDHDYGHNHPDFANLDSSGSRIGKVNWSHGGSYANQPGGAHVFSSHGIQAVSAAIGNYSGFAKRANGYLVYGGSTTSALDAIKTWHESKSVNSETGLKNPTIVAYEFQYYTTFFNYAIKVEDISSVTGPSGTASRPGSGWGSDLTPFTTRDIIPRKVLDPVDSNWYWMITFPRQGTEGGSSHRYEGLKIATEALWDAGITVLDSGGNYTHTYSNEDDEDSTYCTISGSVQLYEMGNTGATTTITRTTTTTANWYPHYHYGAAGINKCISIAAGGNSEANPVLDYYTSRGPAVNIIGRGVSTYTCGDKDDTVYADGNRWGSFGGNSCAIPTVAGSLACQAEKFYVKNGVWPTPDQLKNIGIAEARPGMVFQDTINWENVPAASDTNINPTRGSYGSSGHGHLEMKAGQTSWQSYHYDAAGTPNNAMYINAQAFNREHTHGRRPTSGVLYPRPRKFGLEPPRTYVSA